MKNYINMDSFGSDCPTNWEEIADFLNDIIRTTGIEDDHDAVNDLWEQYCNGDIPAAPEAVYEEDHKIWYALMTGPDDTDCGTGTFDRDEAFRRVREMRDDYPDAYIAVIDDGPDPICIEEIHDI